MQLTLLEDIFACPKRRIDSQLELQNLRVERLGEVVDAARLIASLDMRVLAVHSGDKDDWNVFAGFHFFDGHCSFESVHARHLHIEQDHVDVQMPGMDGFETAVAIKK